MEPDVPAPEGLHLPHGSIWPFALGMSAALTLVGLIIPGPAIFIGLLAFAVTGAGWVREDMRWWENKLGTGDDVGRWGTFLFIGSEVFIFGSLFATYFVFRGQAGVCPEVCHLPIQAVMINTAILFASGATMHWAHHAIRHGDHHKFRLALLLTLVLGTTFLGGQVLEYGELMREGSVVVDEAGNAVFVDVNEEGHPVEDGPTYSEPGPGRTQLLEPLTLQTHPAGATFYMLTGTHGFHVFAGLVFIGIVYYRSLFGQFTAERHVAVETAAIYWHFVDLVWVFVLAVLYFWDDVLNVMSYAGLA